MSKERVQHAPPLNDALEPSKPLRTHEGRFKKGISGNPDGRPKGSKNQITLLRQSLELALREQAAPDMAAVLDRAVELALEGNTNMIKLLLEMHMTKGAPEEKEVKEKVEINISGMERPKLETVSVIDVTPTIDEED